MGDGMVPEATWAETSVHKASRYSCVKCGGQFAGPHALYAHLDGCDPVTTVDANDVSPYQIFPCVECRVRMRADLLNNHQLCRHCAGGNGGMQ